MKSTDYAPAHWLMRQIRLLQQHGTPAIQRIIGIRLCNSFDLHNCGLYQGLSDFNLLLQTGSAEPDSGPKRRREHEIAFH